jgi:hypothetical protein
MVTYENQCCGCAVPAYPCRGDSCDLRHVRVLTCDKCGAEVDKLYIYGSQELCAECVLEDLEVIE